MQRSRGLPVLGIHPLSIFLLIALVGCGSGAPRPTDGPAPQLTLVARLGAVLPESRTPDSVATGELASVAIGHDLRPVAGPARSFRMATSMIVDVDGQGRVRLPLEPGAATVVGRRVALEPVYRDEDGWHDLAPRAAEVVLDESGRPAAVLEVAEKAGETLKIYAKVHGPLPGLIEQVVLPAFEVPPAARLDLGFGVLRLASDRSRVEYTVEACTFEGDTPDVADDVGERPGASDCVRLAHGTTDGSEPGGWIDLRLPLDELAGRRASLRLTSRRDDEAASPLALPTWTEASLWAPDADRKPRRNVVLVSLDTLRADHLTSYGHPVDTAPFLDEAFARRGTLFERLVAAASSTAGSHMSMFSGLNVLEHQVVNMYRALPVTHATLAERLRADGYQTGAVTENGALLLSQGFGRGFASYYENKAGDLTSFEGQAETTLARAESWLRRHRDVPFFLFVHTYQVHYPYTPPPGYDALIPELPAEVAPPSDIPPDRHPVLYDREIRYLDDLLRAFFTRIEDLGLDRDTLFVVTSDHGDEFYEHDHLDHGGTVFESVTHVPLLMRGPGVPAGRRVATPVGHIDLAPTILDLVDAAPAPDVSGVSLRPLIEGPDAMQPRPLYSDTRVEWTLHRQAGGEMLSIPTPTIGVRLGDKKAIREVTENGYRVRFYDLARDPGEQSPEPIGAKREYAALEFLAKRYPVRYNEIRAQRTVLDAAEGRPDEGESLGRVPDYEAQLEALGYVR